MWEDLALILRFCYMLHSTTFYICFWVHQILNDFFYQLIIFNFHLVDNSIFYLLPTANRLTYV